jgi:hypothetical protein
MIDQMNINTVGVVLIALLFIALVAIRLQKQINRLKREANRLRQRVNEDEKKEQRSDDDLK